MSKPCIGNGRDQYQRSYRKILKCCHWKNKCDVISALVHKINPEIEIKSFKEGVNDKNRNEFLSEVDLYLDGLDF